MASSGKGRFLSFDTISSAEEVKRVIHIGSMRPQPNSVDKQIQSGGQKVSDKNPSIMMAVDLDLCDGPTS